MERKMEMGQIVEGRRITLAELKKMAEASRDNVWDIAGSVGRTPKIYLHWTAGHYGQCWDDYHINIDKDGSIYVTTEDLSEVLEHTWKRNTGAIGVTLECCADATTNDIGSESPTSKQIDSMAQVIMTLCNALWLTINKECVLTHGEAADNEDGDESTYGADDCYGPHSGRLERWDLEFLGTDESPKYDPDGEMRGGDVLRGKAIWYRNREDES